MGSFEITRHNAGQERSVCTPEKVLHRFADFPKFMSGATELDIRHEKVLFNVLKICTISTRRRSNS